MEQPPNVIAPAGGLSEFNAGLERRRFENAMVAGGFECPERGQYGGYLYAEDLKAWAAWELAVESERDACALECERLSEIFCSGAEHEKYARHCLELVASHIRKTIRFPSNVQIEGLAATERDRSTDS